MSQAMRNVCAMTDTMTGQLTPPRHDSGSSTISSIWSSKVPREKPSLSYFLPRKRYPPIMSHVPAPPRPQYDFIKPLAFVFEDPNWIPKLLMGGLFTLASVLLVGIFFIYGYLARLVRNVVAGVEHPLPEWTDLGEMFGEGAMLFVAAFDFRTIAAFLRNNALNYVLAYLDWMVARMAAPLGFILCCVGLFVTSFWSMAVAAHAFAQVYRMSETK